MKGPWSIWTNQIDFMPSRSLQKTKRKLRMQWILSCLISRYKTRRVLKRLTNHSLFQRTWLRMLMAPSVNGPDPLKSVTHPSFREREVRRTFQHPLQQGKSTGWFRQRKLRQLMAQGTNPLGPNPYQTQPIPQSDCVPIWVQVARGNCHLSLGCGP